MFTELWHLSLRQFISPLSTAINMVRAELGAGNRDAAVDLLERLKTRLV